MERDYLDEGPQAVEKLLETFTDAEHSAFDKGYIAALLAVLEHITESKTRLVQKMLDEDTSSHGKAILQSRVHILDIYEKHYKKRVKVLDSSPTKLLET